jgi:hypothetical protein
MLYLKHTTLGPVECDISIGPNSRWAGDAYILVAYDDEGNKIDNDNFLDDLQNIYAAEIQEYAVENLGCYWD